MVNHLKGTEVNTSTSRQPVARVRYRRAVGRKPQPDSRRTSVLLALRRRRVATCEALSEELGFDVRHDVGKLIFQGWAVRA